MWLKCKFKPAELDIDCKTIAITPFLSNQEKYLTPVNAVEYFLKKVTPNELVFCLLVTSSSEKEFIKQLGLFSSIFSLNEINRAHRLARSLHSIETTEMVLPNHSSQTLSKPISTSQTRLLNNAKNTSKKTEISIDSMQNASKEFKALKSDSMANLEAQSGNAKSGQIELLFNFCLANELRDEIPNQNHAFSFLIGFTGNDIYKFLGLIDYELI